MKKYISFLLLSLILSINSFSQSSTITKGTSVKIIEIGNTDSYFSEKNNFVGKDATVLGDLNKLSNGFYSGTLETASGRTCFFTEVKLIVNSTQKSASTSSTSSSSTSSNSSFITGKIKSGTSVYVAEISPQDSYFDNRYDKVGQKGTVTEDMNMKDDGYYSGNFKYDDGRTAYFYKVKFSKKPVSKIEQPTSTTTQKPTSTLDSSYDYSSLAYLFGADSDDWNDAKNDLDIVAGDKVKITAISEEDTLNYPKRDRYIGKQGIAEDDIDNDGDGYYGTIKLDNGKKVYFYLVKLEKVSSSNSSSSYTNSSTSSTTNSNADIAKNTRVIVTDVGPNDSYFSNKSNYIRKKGKVVDGLTNQGGDYYSGKIVFDDGTDAYFYNVKVTVLN